STPSVKDVLSWNGSNWVPDSAPGLPDIFVVNDSIKNVDIDGRFRVVSTSTTAPASGSGVNILYNPEDQVPGRIFSYDHSTSTTGRIGIGGSGTAIVINEYGNVGIGVTDAVYKLAVSGTTDDEIV